jgi:hypothetical protein
VIVVIYIFKKWLLPKSDAFKRRRKGVIDDDHIEDDIRGHSAHNFAPAPKNHVEEPHMASATPMGFADPALHQQPTLPTVNMNVVSAPAYVDPYANQVYNYGHNQVQQGPYNNYNGNAQNTQSPYGYH